VTKFVEQSDGTVNILMNVLDSLVYTVTRDYNILSPSVTEKFLVTKLPTGQTFKNWSSDILAVSDTASTLSVTDTDLGAAEYYYKWIETDSNGISTVIRSGKIIVQP